MRTIWNRRRKLTEWERMIRVCVEFTGGNPERAARVASYVASLPGAPSPPAPEQPVASSEPTPEEPLK